MGISAFFLWHMLFTIASAVAFWALARQRILRGQSAEFRWEILGRLKVFLGWTWVTFLFSVFLNQLDKLVLSRDASMADFGRYSIFASLIGLSLNVVGSITSAVYPVLAWHREAEEGRFEELCLASNHLVALLTLPFLATLLLLPDQSLLTWAGIALAPADRATWYLLVLGMFFNIQMHTTYSVHLITGSMRRLATFNFLLLVVLVPVSILLCRTYLALGAALLTLFLHGAYVLIFTPFTYSKPKLLERPYRLHAVFFKGLVVCLPIAALFRFLPSPTARLPALLELSASLLACFAILVLATWKATGRSLECFRRRDAMDNVAAQPVAERSGG
jgi:O-antigen/teichoic acid export membrane protein